MPWSARSPRRLVAALAISSALAGCRGVPPAPRSFSAEAVVLDLPVLEQDELYSCGLVSISALCQYHDVELPAGRRVELVRIAREREGLSGDDVRAALEQAGMEVFLFSGALDHGPTGILHHLDRGRPLLVLLSDDGTSHHYSLLVGYDPVRQNVVLLDPRRGRRLSAFATFERAWTRSQRFTLLAVPHEHDLRHISTRP